ncbi:hypothetical protein SAMN04488570_1457 [Nocardioides scoriae]|uniref:Uncharacterized protein n=1 Tax=Nocardioides scoriae TaxID=642780 RepID=A0A1H1QMQ9_9ACTN|nr:hypothetical protein [Nocardioides scoriae]SDS24742.1 hypothetical protein SAMN04488570_1457 [Nocardioides scoriae]
MTHPADADRPVAPAPRSRYAELPPAVRFEDLRAVHDVRPDPVERGAQEAETDWLLRTVGIG